MGGVHSPGSRFRAAQSLDVSWSHVHSQSQLAGRTAAAGGLPAWQGRPRGASSSAHPGRARQRRSFRRLQCSRVWLAIMYF